MDNVPRLSVALISCILGSWLPQAQAGREHGESHPPVQSSFRGQPLDMAMDGVDGDPQPFGDLLIGEPTFRAY